MAQESGSDAKAVAATLRQKTRVAETSFTFHPDHLDYIYASSRGTRVERRIGWNLVPPFARMRRNEEPDLRAKGVLRLAVVFAVLSYAALFRTHIGPLLILSGYAAVFCFLTVLISRHFRVRNSVLPTSQGNIVVLADPEHDVILARVLEGRRAYLRRFAVIDQGRSVRWNLQRQRWLFEQDAIDKNEFVSAQTAILPAVPDALLRPVADPGPDHEFEQHFLNDFFSFHFKADRFNYRRRTGLGAEYAITVKYLDLPEPTTAMQIGMPSALMPTATFCLVLIGVGYVLQTMQLFPESAFVGFGGSQSGMTVLAPGVAIAVLAVMAARRFMRMVCTKLPSDIMILRNRQHDAIFAELKRRQRVALSAMAEPDPLLAPGEQASLLAALAQRGIVDVQQIPEILARAAVLQAHLGLAEPGPEHATAMPDGAPPQQSSPPPTIH